MVGAGLRLPSALVVGSLIAVGLLSVLPVVGGTQSRFEGQGRIVAVSADKPSVTLDHGPIEGLMAAMRMEFPVRSADLLRGLRAGDVVRFALEPRGSEWVVGAIHPVAPPAASVQAPDFALPTLTGGSVRLADLHGKAVVLNFWATWCVPCRTEMSTLEALYRRYRADGLEVLAVNLDRLSTAGVETFVKEVQVSFPILLDPAWSTTSLYGVVGLPTTYLIDRTGHVVVREVGERDWADDASRAAVAKLLR